KKLLKKTVEEAKRIGISEIFAEVYSKNKALHFFMKNGFGKFDIDNIKNTWKNDIVLLKLVTN
ncbi:MAG: hypothetical protein ACP5RT_01445, partial [Candidatus Micrarchaeia archaeon]